MDDSSSQDDRGDEDMALRREKLIETATTHLNAARACIPELEALLAALTPKVKSVHATGLIPFVRDLKHDVQGIEAILQELRQLRSKKNGDAAGPEPDDDAARADLDAIWKRLEPRTTDAYHSSTRWQALRRCADLVAVKRTFQGSAPDLRRAAVLERGLQTDHEKVQLHRTIKEQAKTEVAVVDRGACWIDIRWISADRLARQMTDSGWSWGEYERGDIVSCDEWEDMPFVRQVRRVVAAARLNRHEYRIPAVRLVLPNLARGAHPDIDVLLDQLPRLDPGVDLVLEDASSDFCMRRPPPLADTIRDLVGTGSLQVPLTDTLNLEHTVLVDLISDLTHLRLTPQPWQSRTTRAQIEEENAHPDGVMAPILYPLLRGRRLVCTHEAAEHFHEMLTTVGTATERARGRLLVPYYAEELRAAYSPAILRERFDALSERPLPADLQFPVEVLADDGRWDVDRVRSLVEDDGSGVLPPVALEIARRDLLKSSKLSTYMYGWRAGVVTVTSNKEVRAHMRTWVEAGRCSDDERGPMLYCVDVTRNLLAKSAVPPPGWPGLGEERNSQAPVQNNEHKE
ncbi:hypothetical protein A9K55_003060 [Cordyceps militaris]|uniref:DUF1308 domain-containing protein n=1 Tax=Cordyceps militaris TaxID=73501 RepID=A0A2H4S622_CORMI|nr:hypothetical protein A9K55_003060 [Cordyceps militaris]